MSESQLILIHVFCPTLSGVIFFLLAVHLQGDVKSIKLKPQHHFSWALFSLSFFLLTRPLQLLLGPHPFPVLIVGLRFFVFNGLFCPLLLLSGFRLAQVKWSLRFQRGLFFIHTVAALIYGGAMLLGADGSQTIFYFGNWPAEDTLIPSMTGPWYFREISLLAQAVPMAICSFGAAWVCWKKARQVSSSLKLKKRLHIFIFGVMILSLAFVIGTLAQQWWLYYFASLPAAFMMTYGFYQESQELKSRSEKINSFLEKELLAMLHGEKLDPSKSIELFKDLDFYGKPSCAWILHGLSSVEKKGGQSFQDQQDVEKSIKKWIMEQTLPIYSLPMGETRFALLLDSSELSHQIDDNIEQEHAKHKNLFDRKDEIGQTLLEVLERQFGTSFCLGMGREKDDERLTESFLEAENAVRRAVAKSIPMIHFEDQQASNSSGYPLVERDEFLKELKYGSVKKARPRLKILLERLEIYMTPNDYRIRCIELLGYISQKGLESSSSQETSLDQSKVNMEALQKIADITAMQSLMLQALEQLSKDNLSESGNTLKRDVVHLAKNFIESHYADNINRDMIAKATHVSVSYLTKQFRESGSQSINQYLTEVRLKKAGELLEHSEESITQIAFLVGYKDSNYFSTVFSKTFGVSPKVYREKAKHL